MGLCGIPLNHPWWHPSSQDGIFSSGSGEGCLSCRYMLPKGLQRQCIAHFASGIFSSSGCRSAQASTESSSSWFATK
jgi:hypothetical protein